MLLQAIDMSICGHLHAACRAILNVRMHSSYTASGANEGRRPEGASNYAYVQ